LRFGASVTEIVSSQGRITTVTAVVGDETMVFHPANVVAAIPIERLRGLVSDQGVERLKSPSRRADTPALRAVVLVYLFLDEPPRFPHAWLEVTSPDLRAGRITNYAAFGGAMVPQGKTCLCVEFFCQGNDPLFDLDTESVSELALSECANSRLVNSEKCFDRLVLKLPGADAATSWRDWQGMSGRESLTALRHLDNLYFVNRPGTDQATLAGLEAAKAILSANRRAFDEQMDLGHVPGSTQRTWATDLLRSRL
jgi:hypothetical protein